MDLTFASVSDKIRAVLGNVLMYLRNLILKPTTLRNWNIIQRQAMQKALDLYNGNQLVHLEQTMDNQFQTSAARNLKQQLQFLNITKKITDTIAMTFKNGISVTAVNEAEQEIYDEIIDSINLDAVMQDVDRKTFLTKQVFVKVNAETEEDGSTDLKLDIITPQYVEVTTEENDPYCFDTIVYPKVVTNPSISNPEGIFCYWDNETFKLIDQSGREIPNELNPANVNPYGEIPIVLFRESLPSEGQFWLTMPEDLLMAQDSLNVKLTMLNQLLKLQSFGIPVLVNPSANLNGEVNISIDPSKPIIINDDATRKGDFKFVSPDSKITEVQDAIDRDIQRIANFYGLNPDDLIATGQVSTADSKNASNAAINEVRESRKLIFTPAINELFEMIRTVWNVHNPLQQLSEDGVIVKINDPKRSYATIDDMIKEADWKLKNNLTTLADILVATEDDLTLQEAKDKIEENKLENNPTKNEGNQKSSILINNNNVSGSMMNTDVPEVENNDVTGSLE